MLGSSHRAILHHHQQQQQQQRQHFYPQHQLQPFVFQQQQIINLFKQQQQQQGGELSPCLDHPGFHPNPCPEPTSVLDLWSPSSNLSSSLNNNTNNLRRSSPSNSGEIISVEAPVNPQRDDSQEQQLLLHHWRSGQRSGDRSLDEWLADLQQQKLIQGEESQDDQEEELRNSNAKSHIGLFRVSASASASSSSEKHQIHPQQQQYEIQEELESMLESFPSNGGASAPPCGYTTQQLAKWLLGEPESGSASSQEIQIHPEPQLHHLPQEIFFSGKPVQQEQIFHGLDHHHQQQQQQQLFHPAPAFPEPHSFQPELAWPPATLEPHHRKRRIPDSDDHYEDNIHRFSEAPEISSSDNKLVMQLLQQQQQQGMNSFSRSFAIPLVAEPRSWVRSSPSPSPPPGPCSWSRKLQRVSNSSSSSGEAINRAIPGGFSAISAGSPLLSPNATPRTQLQLQDQPPQLAAAAAAASIRPTISVPDEGGLSLMDQLLQLAQAIDTGSSSLAQSILARLNQHLFLCQQQQQQGKRIQRLAFFFKEALAARLSPELLPPDESPDHHTPDLLFRKLHAYSSFCDISPLLNFSYLSANQAILEATRGEASVHILDYDPRFGTQWASLFTDLARLSPAPHLRLTLAGPDTTRLSFIAESLRDFATSLPIACPPEVHVAAAGNPGDLATLVSSELASPVVFNFMFTLNGALPEGAPAAAAGLFAARPRLVTVAERELDDCDGRFQRRFVEVLKYYAFLMDSMGPEDGEGIFRVEAELVSPAIRNAVATEGRRRTERHLRLAGWRGVMTRGGFDTVAMSDVARMQGECLIKRHPHGKNFEVVMEEGGLLLGWQGKNLVSVSAWAPPSFDRVNSISNNC